MARLSILAGEYSAIFRYSIANISFLTRSGMCSVAGVPNSIPLVKRRYLLVNGLGWRPWTPIWRAGCAAVSRLAANPMPLISPFLYISHMSMTCGTAITMPPPIRV